MPRHRTAPLTPPGARARLSQVAGCVHRSRAGRDTASVAAAVTGAHVRSLVCCMRACRPVPRGLGWCVHMCTALDDRNRAACVLTVHCWTRASRATLGMLARQRRSRSTAPMMTRLARDRAAHKGQGRTWCMATGATLLPRSSTLAAPLRTPRHGVPPTSSRLAPLSMVVVSFPLSGSTKLVDSTSVWRGA